MRRVLLALAWLSAGWAGAAAGVWLATSLLLPKPIWVTVAHLPTAVLLGVMVRGRSWRVIVAGGWVGVGILGFLLKAPVQALVHPFKPAVTDFVFGALPP